MAKKIPTSDKHAYSVGKFYSVCDKYMEKFKIGGKQKLQKIIGEDLFYKKGNNWWWNNPKIIRMSTIQLNKLTEKIQNSK